MSVCLCMCIVNGFFNNATQRDQTLRDCVANGTVTVNAAWICMRCQSNKNSLQ